MCMFCTATDDTSLEKHDELLCKQSKIYLRKISNSFKQFLLRNNILETIQA